MPRNVPSSYDPELSSGDIRELKKIIRGTPGISQNIWSARRIDDHTARVLTGGPIAGDILEFKVVDGNWEMLVIGHWVT